MSNKTARADTSYIVDWQRVPTLSCIICCSPRTGSSLLSYALEDSGQAGCPIEYFSPMGEASSAGKWGLPAHYSLGNYLRSIAAETMTDNGAIATKLFIPHLTHLLYRARAEFTPGLSENEVMEECFPHPRYVYLRRNDRVRQAISFMRAMNTKEFERTQADANSRPGAAADFDPDPARIRSYVEAFAKQEREWQDFFERNQITADEVEYEDLANDYQGTVLRVLDSFGITPPSKLRLPPPRTVRQSDDVTERIVARYAEYEERVEAGTTPNHTVRESKFSTPAEVIHDIDRRLKQGVSWLASVTATCLFELTGDNGGSFHIAVCDGTGNAGPGSAENADATFCMPTDTFMEMRSGTDDDKIIAFINGDVTTYGDQTLASALVPLWFGDEDLAGPGGK